MSELTKLLKDTISVQDNTHYQLILTELIESKKEIKRLKEEVKTLKELNRRAHRLISKRIFTNNK